MRKLENVIDQMLSLIPISEQQLILDLEKVKSSVEFASPEMVGFWWREAADNLVDGIGEEPTEAWHKNVIKIWQDDPNYFGAAK